jgi:hypothetical protein
MGRSKAGKTRLAYDLAKAAKDSWVLRVDENFAEWKDLDIPYYPLLKQSIVWIIDDLDKYVGKSDLALGDRILREVSHLRVIVTCRPGSEWDIVTSNLELKAWVSVLGSSRCAEFTQEELSAFAERIGEAAHPELYDGTPGSVVLALQGKKSLLRGANRNAKAVLWAMQLLRLGLVFDPTRDLVKGVIREIYRFQVSDEEFEESVRWLVKNSILRSNGTLEPVHDAYVTELLPYGAA